MFVCLLGFVLRLNYMTVSQASVVFRDAVASSVKDFPTTCSGQNAHTCLRPRVQKNYIPTVLKLHLAL